ncbi:MAG TPA: alpha/beta fold hydrolase [Candidatus Acidoferrum sp.]|nr:alpha/beta fold hydrolase [Candidatus Acidoferrum sp.]
MSSTTISRFRFAASLGLILFYLLGCGNHISSSSAGGQATEQSIHFASGNITLAGTLILPAGSQPHSAVVLFHGSGPQARDLSTARWFAAHGIAALAYDKRGVGESTGDFRAGPFMDVCDDGLAAIQFLKSRKEIDPRHIGVWGLSQGGWLGPLAVSRSSDITFVIAVSGPGVSPGDQMLFYYAKELEGRGLPESQVEEATAVRRDVWNYLFTRNGYEHARDELEQARKKPWYAEVKSQQDGLFDKLAAPSDLDKPGIVRFRREMTYDPLPALRALRVPALFIFGDADRLVPVEKSVAIIRDTLTQSGAKDFTIRVLHNADHQMFVADGGSYAIHPEYRETMQKWLVAHVPGSH